MNFFNSKCLNCQKVLALKNHYFCSNCTQLLLTQNYCLTCANKTHTTQDYCGQCLNSVLAQRNLFDAIIFATNFSPEIAAIIHNFKYSKQPQLAHGLGRLMLLNLRNLRSNLIMQNKEMPQLLIPVPLHPKRMIERGFNQSELLAQYLSKKLNIAYDKHSLTRAKNDTHQRGLNYEQRIMNLQNSFNFAQNSFENNLKKHNLNKINKIAIIDDVVTTKATATAIAKLLRSHGIEKIELWAIAKTQLQAKYF